MTNTFVKKRGDDESIMFNRLSGPSDHPWDGRLHDELMNAYFDMWIATRKIPDLDCLMTAAHNAMALSCIDEYITEHGSEPDHLELIDLLSEATKTGEMDGAMSDVISILDGMQYAYSNNDVIINSPQIEVFVA